MPVWHEQTKALRASGKLTVVGITQEQHPDRCLLFARWKGFDWPILWDPFNMTGSHVVPRFTLIDEHGVVRSLRANPRTIESEFIAQTFPAPKGAADVPKGTGRELIQALRAKKGSAERRYYDALSALLWHAGRDGDRALQTLEHHAKEHPKDAAAQWRLGVALRMRYDSLERQEGDFQSALDHWVKGLALNPGQYIYRRRIQQYGPRLDKPYPFYPWIEEAVKALEKRGEKPPPLAAPLSGAERTGRAGADLPAQGAKEPDPKAKIERIEGLLEMESSVAWHTGPRKGDAARVHMTLRPAGTRVLLWDPDAGPVTIWITPPEGWRTDRNLIKHALQGRDKAEEEVPVDFEVRFPGGKAVAGVIRGYALYYACLDGAGECKYLRQDFEIQVPKRP